MSADELTDRSALDTIDICSLTACARDPARLASTAQRLGDRPFGIAVDDADVYWTDHDDFAVMKCAKGGCSDGPITVASNQLSAARIVVDAHNIYWATVDTVMKLAK